MLVNFNMFFCSSVKKKRASDILNYRIIDALPDV